MRKYLLLAILLCAVSYEKGRNDRLDKDLALLSNRQAVVDSLVDQLKYAREQGDNFRSEFDDEKFANDRLMDEIDGSACSKEIHQKMRDDD